MPTMENTDKVATTEKAFTAAFLGLCRALEHQKILMPGAIAQEIFLQRNMLKDDPESRNVKKVLETITKKLEEPVAPVMST
jgi:hypothetical protein